MSDRPANIHIAWATEREAPVILDLIRALAEYERLTHTVTATEEQLRRTLFGERPCAEALLASMEGEHVGFAVFFTNYSTFLARPGIYLEDLFVRPHARGKGIGAALLASVARIAVERGCARMEWSVLNWNESSIEFYKKLGAAPMHEWTIYRLAAPGIEDLASRFPASFSLLRSSRR